MGENMKKRDSIGFGRVGAALCILLSASCALAQPRPNKGVGRKVIPVVWAPNASRPGAHANLGPTGARGWVDGHRIHVIDVAKRSPADGPLRINDAIIGANGERFIEGADPRVALGKAVAVSETAEKKGVLALTVLRGGEEKTVTVRLRVLGEYSRTWPFDCEKSRRILADACRWMATQQYPDGHIDGELGGATAWAGLLWLAAGDVEYLDNARRAAYWLVDTKYSAAKVSLNNWALGYAGILLAEYYLITGDSAVIPELKGLADAIAKGQMACGSWGHSSPWGGYGAVNSVGLPCFMTLVLARECGIRVDEAAVKRSTQFFRKYVGRGWVPYGDHKPWRGNSSNGKSAMAAVAFALLGDDAEAVKDFSESVAASGEFREVGHTGSYFSIMWGPPAAILARRENFHTFMNVQKWYYDLSRTWDGGIASLPNPENLGGRTPGTYALSGPSYTTAGIGLTYALPQKRLRILGAEPGVFGRKASGPTAKAMALLREKKWQELEAAVAKLKGKPAADLRAVIQLQDQSVAATLAGIERTVGAGDVYRALRMLEALQRLLGEDCPKLADARKLLAENEKWIETGKDYYEKFGKAWDYGWQYWHYYGKHAAEVLAGGAPVQPPGWQALVETSEKAPQDWKLAQWGGEASDPPTQDPAPKEFEGWTGLEFDDSKWADRQGPVGGGKNATTAWQERDVLLRKAFKIDEGRFVRARLNVTVGQDCSAEVYLNGFRVAEIVQGSRKGYAAIELSPSAVKLLHRGQNLLAVHARKGEGKNQTLDVGLQATRN